MSQSHDKLPINSFLAQQQLPCTATAPLHSNSFLPQQQLPGTTTALVRCHLHRHRRI
jgi:hypothetical protein